MKSASTILEGLGQGAVQKTCYQCSYFGRALASVVDLHCTSRNYYVSELSRAVA